MLMLNGELGAVAGATRTWRLVECSSRIVGAPRRTEPFVSLYNKNHNVEMRVYKSYVCDVMLEDYMTAQGRPLIGQPLKPPGHTHPRNLPSYASSCTDNIRFWTWSASCAVPGRLALVEEPSAP